MQKAAIPANQRDLKPMATKKGAANSAKMVRSKEMSVPKPKKFMNFTGSPLFKLAMYRSILANPWGIMSKANPRRNKSRPPSCIILWKRWSCMLYKVAAISKAFLAFTNAPLTQMSFNLTFFLSVRGNITLPFTGKDPSIKQAFTCWAVKWG